MTTKDDITAVIDNAITLANCITSNASWLREHLFEEGSRMNLLALEQLFDCLSSVDDDLLAVCDLIDYYDASEWDDD